MRHSVCIISNYHKHLLLGYSYPILELRKRRLCGTSQVKQHISWQELPFKPNEFDG